MDFVSFVKNAAIRLLVLAVVTVTLFISMEFVNNVNRIEKGIVVNKNFVEAHTNSMLGFNGAVFFPIVNKSPDTYVLTLEGEKWGKTVNYDLTVSAEDYENYNIGDYYDEE